MYIWLYTNLCFVWLPTNRLLSFFIIQCLPKKYSFLFFLTTASPLPRVVTRYGLYYCTIFMHRISWNRLLWLLKASLQSACDWVVAIVQCFCGGWKYLHPTCPPPLGVHVVESCLLLLCCSKCYLYVLIQSLFWRRREKGGGGVFLPEKSGNFEMLDPTLGSSCDLWYCYGYTYMYMYISNFST